MSAARPESKEGLGTSMSGAYIYRGPREYQLYADIPESDALVAVLELDTDCSGTVYTYLMRGGFEEGRTTAKEFRNAAVALGELYGAAMALWPKQMTEDEK